MFLIDGLKVGRCYAVSTIYHIKESLKKASYRSRNGSELVPSQVYIYERILDINEAIKTFNNFSEKGNNKFFIAE